MPVRDKAHSILARLGIEPGAYTRGDMPARSPLTGEIIAEVTSTTPEAAAASIEKSHAAFEAWREVPAPRRGELVRLFGEEIRACKDDLGQLVTIEAGKIPSEGLGEIQEMIDICDFALGLSRQLYGLTITSERFRHRMMETWHPLGVIGVISAFNFPAAVWAWNTALALVCGNSVVWKPSEKTPLTALACQAVLERALAQFEGAPENLSTILIGDASIGETLVDHPRVPLVSATGSTRMGRAVGPRLAKRFARSILELGGNNAGIVCPSADTALALRAITFSAVGTAGQRCTTMRRLFLHDTLYDETVGNLKKVYKSIRVGDPGDDNVLVGPLVDQAAYDAMQSALAAAADDGGAVFGGERVDTGAADAFYVRPALVEMPEHKGVALTETFAPILYIFRYSDFEDALRMHNAVGAGLSSCIFTSDLREAELFVSVRGSDCGISNVNIGTSGAEIGGAFGGEKETGGGRESGSDAWKGYMRRSTTTVNYSKELPLAQGVSFEVN